MKCKTLEDILNPLIFVMNMFKLVYSRRMVISYELYIFLIIVIYMRFRYIHNVIGCFCHHLLEWVRCLRTNSIVGMCSAASNDFQWDANKVDKDDHATNHRQHRTNKDTSPTTNRMIMRFAELNTIFWIKKGRKSNIVVPKSFIIFNASAKLMNSSPYLIVFHSFSTPTQMYLL